MNVESVFIFNFFVVCLIAHQFWLGFNVRRKLANHRDAALAEAIQNNFSRARCELYDLYIREEVKDSDAIYKKIDEVNTFFMRHKQEYEKLARHASDYLLIVESIRQSRELSDTYRPTLHKTAVALRSVEEALAASLGLPAAFDASVGSASWRQLVHVDASSAIRIRLSSPALQLWESLRAIAQVRSALYSY